MEVPTVHELNITFCICRPFYKTLPRSSAFVYWISVRFYETDVYAVVKSREEVVYFLCIDENLEVLVLSILKDQPFIFVYIIKRLTCGTASVHPGADIITKTIIINIQLKPWTYKDIL